MFRKLLKAFRKAYAIGQPIDLGPIAARINAKPLSEVQLEAEALLARADLWDVSFRNNTEDIELSELGALNRQFFEKYADVQANFTSMQLGYLGRPDWLPPAVPSDLRIVGHTIEQEYLFCSKGCDEVFEVAIDDLSSLSSPSSMRVKSAFHAVIFYHLAYGSPMVTPATPNDADEILRMRRILWPDCSEEMHRLEIAEQSGEFATVLVYRRANGKLGGFIELSVRNRVDGSLSPQVGYIEGWFVDEDLQGGGIGRQLVASAEQWTRAQGLSEIASDAELENENSIRAHAALGFQETFRLVHFLKRL